MAKRMDTRHCPGTLYPSSAYTFDSHLAHYFNADYHEHKVAMAVSEPVSLKQNQQPKPAAKASEQARNRENQRRLRERRKGYTEELEQKVRAFEREGAHATAVMQRAARVVVEENRLLRQLLCSHGVSSLEIDAFVKSSHPAFGLQTVQLVRSASDRPLPVSSDDRKEHLESTQANVELNSVAQASTCNHHPANASVAPPLHSSVNMPDMFTSSSPDRRVDLGCASATALLLGVTGCTTSSSSRKAREMAGDEMDCEEAARIIASLRGGEDPQDVWPELGCSRANRTTVKNAHVMSLVD